MPRNRFVNFVIQTTLFLGFVCLYTFTLNSDVQPADSGEFQVAAITLGIPHPPGYPLFTMLGWLFARVPIGSPFARVSFLSVIASAAALVLVSLAVQQLSRGEGEQGRGGAEERRSVGEAALISPSPPHPLSPAPLLLGLLAAGALGTSTTFWAQATTTNIRSLTAFFAAAMLWALARLLNEGQRTAVDRQDRMFRSPFLVSLYLFSLAFGLGIGHHVSLIFVGAVLGACVVLLLLRRHAGWQVFGVAALLFVVTQLVWLYLPLRDAAGARFAPGNLISLDGLLSHIFARGFAGDMLAFATPEYLFDRLAVLPTLFAFEFSPAILVCMLVALLALLWKRRATGITLLLAFGLHLFITITYRAPQTVEYAMPAWIILCVILGAGGAVLIQEIAMILWRYFSAHPVGKTQWMTRAAPRGLSIAIVAVAGVLLLRDGLERLPSFTLLAQDRSTRALAEGVLVHAALDSTVLSQWHQATPMWALQDVEGLRRDVHVEYVYPRGAQPYADTFAESAVESAQTGTTYVTSLYAVPFAGRGLYVVPQNGLPAWEVFTSTLTQTLTQHGSAAGNLLFDSRIEVFPLKAAMDKVGVGQMLDIVVTWRAVGVIMENEALTVRIMRANGKLAGNADIRLDPAMQADEVRSQRVRLGIPLDLTPGEYQILVGAYRQESAGFVALQERSKSDFVTASPVIIAPTCQQPITQHPISPSAFNDPSDPDLVGVDYDTGVGGQLRVLTHWQLGTLSSTVNLFDREGNVLGATQQIAAATDMSQPQYVSVVFDVPLMRGLQLGRGAHGQPDFTLPDFTEGERYVPFANEMVLVGSDTQREGSQLKVSLQWLSARPITTDYVVSARVNGDDFYAAHDGVPALGALPTLKWIRGSRVSDRHPIALGDYNGSLRGTVVVYDAFTQQPLLSLDERYESGITFEVK
ncbi:MAG: DUF2723 domain-containing protein [Chloroflexi bacterium]|nr:DUF2723 domain-containing protein [Chloroflexota bacterium]